jgi:hypothetical protein
MPNVSGLRYTQYVCPVVQGSGTLGENDTLNQNIVVPNGVRGVVLAHVTVRREDGSHHESQWKLPFSEESTVTITQPYLIEAWEAADGDAPAPVEAIDETVYTVAASVNSGRNFQIEVTSESADPAVNVVDISLQLEHWVPNDPFGA